MVPREFIGILIPAIFIAGILLSTTLASAETVNFRLSTYVVHFDALPVDDVEGHIVGTVLRKGLALFEKGEVATCTNWATVDLIKGNGSFQGYSLLTYQDGSSSTQKFQGTMESGVYKGMAEFTMGTKRFEGIKGTLSITGKALTPYSKEKGTWGDAYFDFAGTYTLPSK